jgi:hypothetical protein
MTDTAIDNQLIAELVHLFDCVERVLISIRSTLLDAGDNYSALTEDRWEELRNDVVALIFHVEARNRLADQLPHVSGKFGGSEEADWILNWIDELGLSRWPAAAQAAGATPHNKAA